MSTAKPKKRSKRPAVKDPETGLTPRALRFVDEYLVDLNATQAAIRAGYSAKTANEIGAENLAKPSIARLVQERLEKRSARTQVTADRVLEEAARIAFVDLRSFYDEAGRLKQPHEWTPEQAAAVSSLESIDEFDGRGDDRVFVGTVRKLKLWDKRAMLETLFKHLGLLKERVEVKGRLKITREIVHVTRSDTAAREDDPDA